MRPDAPCSDDEPERFVRAQAPLIEQIGAELAPDRKAPHWMGFALRSCAIAAFSEALRDLQHPILGERLAACTVAVNALAGIPIETVFPPIPSI